METPQGGAATATPPAPSASPSATPSPAPAPGIFDSIKLESSIGQPQSSEPLADSGSSSGDLESHPNAQPASDALPRPFMGRYKTFTEAEEAYRRSQDEGRRLWEESRSLKAAHEKAISEREAHLRQLQADLEDARNNPPFKEISKEELQALAKEDPLAASEYIAEKKLRDRDLKASKEKREQSEKQKAEYQKQLTDYVVQRDQAMDAHPELFPQKRELRHIEDQFIEMTRDSNGISFLTGRKSTPDILYYLALGWSHHQALIKGNKVKDEASLSAQRKSEADATSSRGPAPSPSNQPLVNRGVLSDQDFNKALVSAAPRGFFGGK